MRRLPRGGPGASDASSPSLTTVQGGSSEHRSRRMRLRTGRSTPRSCGECAGPGRTPGPTRHRRPLPQGLRGPPHPRPTRASPRSRPSSVREGPAAGRSAMRAPGAGGSARRGPAGPAAWRPLSAGLRAGARGWHPGRGARACAGREAVAQAGRARGPGGAARARAAAGSGLTSPGTAPSTPSRCSGTVRAAAGRCWTRGSRPWPSASRSTGCTPALRPAG